MNGKEKNDVVILGIKISDFPFNLNDDPEPRIPIRYKVSDDSGKALTGLIIMPKTIPEKGLPILAYQHGTALNKSWAPSNYDGKDSEATHEIYTVSTSVGDDYIICMADYPGLVYTAFKNNNAYNNSG